MTRRTPQTAKPVDLPSTLDSHLGHVITGQDVRRTAAGYRGGGRPHLSVVQFRAALVQRRTSSQNYESRPHETPYPTPPSSPSGT